MKKFIILTIAMIMATFSMSQANIVEDLNEELDVFEGEMTEINVIFDQLESVKTKELEKINSIPKAANNWRILNQKMEHARRKTVKKIKRLMKQYDELTEKEWLDSKVNIKKQLEINRRLETTLENYMEVYEWILDVEASDVLHQG